tara:strand:- start:447 stop:1886 length:1440 start_codon:yes stop_codon:yes gene_type:complete
MIDKFNDLNERNQFHYKSLEDKKVNSSLGKSFDDEDKVSLWKSFADIKKRGLEQGLWPEYLRGIALRIKLEEKIIENFIGDPSRDMKVEEITAYESTLQALATNFENMNVTIMSADKKEEFEKILSTCSQFSFSDTYELGTWNKVSPSLFGAIKVTKETIIKIHNLHEEKKGIPFVDQLAKQSEIYTEVDYLFEKLEKLDVFILAGILPSFAEKDCAKLVFCTLSEIDLMKEVFPNSRKEDDPRKKKYPFSIRNLGNLEKIPFDIKTNQTTSTNQSSKMKFEEEVIPERNHSNPNDDKSRIKELLNWGVVIGYPAEYCWGLGCDPNSENAVKSILSLKQRNPDEGLILVSGNFEHFHKYLLGLSNKEISKIKASWPGPTTFLVPANEYVPELIKGKHSKVALRLSTSSAIKEVTDIFGGPIVSTSLNTSGQKPAKTLYEAKEYFGERIMYYEGTLDGGDENSDRESTLIVDLLEDKVIR